MARKTTEEDEEIWKGRETDRKKKKKNKNKKKSHPQDKALFTFSRSLHFPEVYIFPNTVSIGASA